MKISYHIKLNFKKGDQCPCCSLLYEKDTEVIHDFETTRELKHFATALDKLIAFKTEKNN